MKKCYFSLNQAAIWRGSCWKILKWYLFQSPPAKRTLICQKKFMEKCYFSLNQAAIWCGSCWKNLEWYLVYTIQREKRTHNFWSISNRNWHCAMVTLKQQLLFFLVFIFCVKFLLRLQINKTNKWVNLFVYVSPWWLHSFFPFSFFPFSQLAEVEIFKGQKYVLILDLASHFSYNIWRLNDFILLKNLQQDNQNKKWLTKYFKNNC